MSCRILINVMLKKYEVRDSKLERYALDYGLKLRLGDEGDLYVTGAEDAWIIKGFLKGDYRMKILFIGGTGTISMAITRILAERGEELYLLNRGKRNDGLPDNVHIIQCDISNEADAAEKLSRMEFDCVGEFIGFEKPQIERDYRLFAGKTKQYIFISSASAYQKPMNGYVITMDNHT